MASSLLTALAGLLYTVVFAALALLRREGFPLRFVRESVVFTGVVVLVSELSGAGLSPVAFLVVLYLLTMRARLLLDLGGLAARRGNLATAERVYRLALALSPGATERSAVAIDRGVLRMAAGDPGAAAEALAAALEMPGCRASTRHLCAAHYNLGVAFRRLGREPEAQAHFRAVVDLWPTCAFARRASAALGRVEPS